MNVTWECDARKEYWECNVEIWWQVWSFMFMSIKLYIDLACTLFL